jgi:hypothetical protein
VASTRPMRVSSRTTNMGMRVRVRQVVCHARVAHRREALSDADDEALAAGAAKVA